GEHSARVEVFEQRRFEPWLHDLALDAEQAFGPRPGPRYCELVERDSIVRVLRVEAASLKPLSGLGRNRQVAGFGRPKRGRLGREQVAHEAPSRTFLLVRGALQ